MPVRIGLIGYGLAGATFHAPLIGAVERLQLAAVATSRTGEAARLGSAVRIEPEPERLISDPSLDLIVVATPWPRASMSWSTSRSLSTSRRRMR
jgi:scyllo-inositol 2-dehydrogenase (NADP+)